jgi:hypothetical protein
MRTFMWITVTASSLAFLGCAENAKTKPTANNARPSSNTTASDNANGRTTVSKPAIGSGETLATGSNSTDATGTNRNATGGNSSEVARPDNTAVNKRDRDADAVVPTDQGNNQADLDKSADIRKRILQNKEMSIKGQNVKVVTLGGKVTLRGPVASDAERKIIEDIAKDVAGADKVTNELEVAP